MEHVSPSNETLVETQSQELTKRLAKSTNALAIKDKPPSRIIAAQNINHSVIIVILTR